MSELTNKRVNRTNFRFQLLATVSAIALLGSMVGSAKAADDSSERPVIWIELGGQLSRLDEGQEAFSPALMDVRPSMFSPSQKFEGASRYSFDETGKISLQPSESDWVFSASVRFGRSAAKRDINQQTNPPAFSTHYSYGSGIKTYAFNPYGAKFAETSVQRTESHSILDFQAGKDVGLGLFGSTAGSSVFSLGVRYAQFSMKSNIALKSDPDWHFVYLTLHFPNYGITHFRLVKSQPYHSNAASLQVEDSFRGIGPSLSWNASSPFLGDAKDGEVTIDWGMNAAILLGRQKARTHHQTTGKFSLGTRYRRHDHVTTYQGPVTPDHTRSRAVTVPNVGGFAGLSFRLEDFKVSAGYRADFFFNAMDGGIDTAHSERVGFYGPFASVSVGLP